MNKNPFKYAHGERLRITKNQKKEIKSFYEDALREVRKDINRVIKKDTDSANAKKIQLDSLRRDIEGYLYEIDRKTERTIKSNMNQMVTKMIDNNNMFLNEMGFQDIKTNPVFKQNVVSRVISGKLYDSKWTLSSAIWGDNAAKQSEINSIIAKGILKNKSLYDISKDLERYVNPNARKEYKWSNLYPGSRRKIDYNAQRLARTMVTHAYQESFVAMTKDNPFIEAYKWITSGGHRVCPLCIDRETSDQYGLGPGIFPKDALPLDHPNGMCTFEVVVTMSEREIADAIADWYLDEGDEDMNKKIDKYVKSLS